MFKFKKNKDIEKEGKKEGEQRKNINEPKFNITVFKPLGRDVPQEIVSFFANQEKDASGAMFLVNKENNFREPLAISRDESIEDLQYRLELKDLTIEEQRKKISAAIDSQEKKIRNTKKGLLEIKKNNGKPENEIQEKLQKINIIDEQKYLRQLKVVYYLINHTKEGSYDSIDGQGFRQRFYLYDEGALIPIFWDRKTASLHTAVDSRIKLYRSDQDLIDADYIDENRDGLGKIFKGLIIFFMIILIIGNIWVFGQNLNRSGELDARSGAMATALEDGNFGQCIQSISKSNEELREYLDEIKNETDQNSDKNINEINTDLT